MSNLSGNFKATVKSLETSPPEDTSKSWIKVSFLLTHEWDGVMEDWSELNDQQWANQMYSLNKTAKNPDAKMTPYEVTVKKWKNDYGFDLFSVDTIEALREKVVGQEKKLILEPDDSDFHKIKWINNLAKPKGPDRTLSSFR